MKMRMTTSSRGTTMPNDTRSDASELCNWMEKMPDKGPMDFHPWRDRSPGGWWAALLVDGSTDAVWVPRDIGLEECHVAEGKLSEAQRLVYGQELLDWGGLTLYEAIHACAGVRLRGLTAVIRSTR